MKVYNTLSRRKEDFNPLDSKQVTIYSCGPTVYNYAHIGNLRTYVFMDLLRRVLKHEGYGLKHVMNITDVGHLVSDADSGDDKMEQAARKAQKSPYEIAAFYTEAFFRDLDRLHIDRPEIIAKATEHIDGMIKYVQALCDKGYGYETSDGIYFDIEKFPQYGKLSRVKLEDQRAGGSERVDVNTEKHNPIDFAIWKKAPKEHIMQWPSPWGMGYPGWHIECSEMSRAYLGELIDIHTGGVDHIPIHHENEIAQSEALTGHKTVNYWLHAEFLLVDGGKMSKSLGNTYTIDELVSRGYDPLAYRYFCLNGHYRNKLNFTWDGLSAAQTSMQRMYELLLRHLQAGDVAVDDIIEGDGRYAGLNVLEAWRQEYEYALQDDLNLPLALSVLWKALRHGKRSKRIYDFVVSTDEIFALDMQSAVTALELQEQQASSEQAASGFSGSADVEIPSDVQDLVARRAEAKKNKQYAEADDIRRQLKEMGYTLIDTPTGTKIELDK